MVLMERGSDTVVKRKTLSAMFLYNITTFFIKTKKYFIEKTYSTNKASCYIKPVSHILKTIKIMDVHEYYNVMYQN